MKAAIEGRTQHQVACQQEEEAHQAAFVVAFEAADRTPLAEVGPGRKLDTLSALAASAAAVVACQAEENLEWVRSLRAKESVGRARGNGKQERKTK